MIIEHLQKVGAPGEFIEWCAEKGFPEIWQTCPRGDWLMGILWPTMPKEKVVLAALDCAEPCLKYCKGSIYSITNAIGCAKNWAKGLANLETLTLAIKQANDEQNQTAVNTVQSITQSADNSNNHNARYAMLSACHAALTPADAQNSVYAASLRGATTAEYNTSLFASADRIRARISMEDAQTALGL